MILKCPCQHCGTNLEFPDFDLHRFAPCPHCQKETYLYQPTPSTPAATGKIIQQTSLLGEGAVLQIIGLVLLFFFPIGTIIGVVLIAVGGKGARQLKCSGCRNPIADLEVRECPVCHTRFAP